MGLPGVSREVVVNELDDVVSDGGGEDSRGSHFFEHGGGIFVVVDTDGWSHELYKLIRVDLRMAQV